MTMASVGSKTVLLVEDNSTARESLALFLQQEGYAVQGAGDGREALEQLKQGPAPAAIVLDLMLPVLSGWEFREQQRRDPALAGIPVVVLSSIAQGTARSTDLGEVVYLQKPADPNTILAAIRRCVG
jgi:CheY-like chemotaxis protein